MANRFGSLAVKYGKTKPRKRRERERRNGRPLPCALTTISTHMLQYIEDWHSMAEKHTFARHEIFFLGLDFLRRVQLESIDIDDSCSASS